MFFGTKSTAADMFAKVTDNKDIMTVDQLPGLAEMIGISPDDIVMYIIVWKCNAKTPLSIGKSEWVDAMQSMRIDSADRLKQALPNLRSEIKTTSNFKSFYYFVFDWVRESPNAKYISNDAACELWNLLFLGRPFPLLTPWKEFISNVFKKAVSRDLWRQTLDFAAVSDLSKYDPNGAWPTAMDDFVEWMKTQQQQQQRPSAA